jgi:hypothetical protein
MDYFKQETSDKAYYKNKKVLKNSYAYSPPNYSDTTLRYATETTVPSSFIRSTREIPDLRDVFKHQIKGLRYNEKEPDIIMPPSREPAFEVRPKFEEEVDYNEIWRQAFTNKWDLENNTPTLPTSPTSPRVPSPISYPTARIRPFSHRRRPVSDKSTSHPEWKKLTDDDGNDYFENTLTGVTQWNPPTTLVLIKDEPVCQRRSRNQEENLNYQIEEDINEILVMLCNSSMNNEQREVITVKLMLLNSLITGDDTPWVISEERVQKAFPSLHFKR